MDKKIAFLSTFDCVKWVYDNHSVPVIAHLKPFFFALVEAKYRIVVITSRTELLSEDVLWREHVLEEDIFFPIGENRVVDGLYNEAVVAAWSAAFKKFGFEAPLGEAAKSWLNYKWKSWGQGAAKDIASIRK